MLENEGNKFQIVIPGCALLAQARNPYSLQGLWIPGSRYARPGMTNIMTYIKHDVLP
jgi:hypothetical protein